jgi:hypothetical protein
MNPHSLILAAGVIAGLAVSVLAQACYPDCVDVEPLRFQGGDFARDSFYGEMPIHPEREEVEANLDLGTNTLTITYDGPQGEVVEVWTLGGIDIW